MSSQPVVQKTSEGGRSSQQVSVRWDDESNVAGRAARLQFEVAECVETKTVTTTTTTKRSYPPLFMREPRPLSSLDSKEYPLASRPTPPELTRFTLDIGGADRDGLPLGEEQAAADQVRMGLPSQVVLARNLLLMTRTAVSTVTEYRIFGTCQMRTWNRQPRCHRVTTTSSQPSRGDPGAEITEVECKSGLAFI